MTLLLLGVVLLVPVMVAGWRARGSSWRRVAPVAADRWSTRAAVGPVTAPSAYDRDRVPSSPGSVARTLGRVEARELARSPWFGIGLGFCVLLFLLFGVVLVADLATWQELFHLAPWLAHPLAGLTVLACHRSVTRDRRDGTDELFGTCPTAPRTRTVGFLLAAPVPVAALVAMYAAISIAVAFRAPLIHGPIGGDVAAEIAGGVVLGAGAVALGVALGRWVRFGLAPVVVVVAVAFASLGINGVVDAGWHPVTSLSTAPTVEDVAPIFQDRPEWWHLAWISGLVAFVALLALARHGWSRSIVVAMTATAAVVVLAGIGATRPMPGPSSQRIAALIAHPEDHQDCRATDGPLEVCAYRSESDLLDQVTARVRPIAAALPTHMEPLTLRQAYDADHTDLPPELRRLVRADDLVRPTGEVALGFGDVLDEIVVDPGFDVAFAALGIPPEPDQHLVPTVLAGQARGVIAIWLASRGLDADLAARASTSPDAGSSDPFERGSLEITDECSAPAAVWSAQDLAAARAVLEQPPSEVGAVVVDGWDRWVLPATGTDELLGALGLPSAGPYDRVDARPGAGC